MTTGLADREKLLDNFQHRRDAISITADKSPFPPTDGQKLHRAERKQINVAAPLHIACITPAESHLLRVGRAW